MHCALSRLTVDRRGYVSQLLNFVTSVDRIRRFDAHWSQFFIVLTTTTTTITSPLAHARGVMFPLVKVVIRSIKIHYEKLNFLVLDLAHKHGNWGWVYLKCLLSLRRPLPFSFNTTTDGRTDKNRRTITVILRLHFAARVNNIYTFWIVSAMTII